ncbi:MAG: hypothetical protein LBT97_10315, partial [Planctomycetota bacterium]|nr:hypothetical protein [Planctomycetota bacterium]
VRSGDTADLAIIPDAKCKPKKLWRESNGGLFDFLQKSTTEPPIDFLQSFRTFFSAPFFATQPVWFA